MLKKILLILTIFTLTAQAQNLPFNTLNTTGSGHFEDQKTTDKPLKSPGKAFFLSLLLPGSGEYYAGAKQYSAYFLSAEVLIWLGMFANDAYADRLVGEYKSYAVQHAAVHRKGKDYQYWIDIGKYDDIYEFNEQRQRERYFDALYEDNTANYWMWDKHENRLTYDKKRLDANEIAARSAYYQAAAMLNHIVSAIHAMYRARQYNERQSQSLSWQLQFEASPPAVTYGVYKARLSVNF